MTDQTDRAEYSRTEYSPGQEQNFSLVLKSLVVPRPIAWVGSISTEGVTNCAPHSFFTMVSSQPPIVMFAAAHQSTTSEGTPVVKDTARNIQDTGDFTISLVDWDHRFAANRTSANLSPDVSEYDAAGVTPLASAVVASPGIAESPAVMECQLHHCDVVGNSTVIFGEVVHASVRTDMLSTDQRGRELPDPALMQPVTRMGRNEWAKLGDVFELDRP